MTRAKRKKRLTKRQRKKKLRKPNDAINAFSSAISQRYTSINDYFALENHGDSNPVLSYISAGGIYIQQNDLERAHEMFNKAIQYAKETGDPHSGFMGHIALALASPKVIPPRKLLKTLPMICEQSGLAMNQTRNKRLELYVLASAAEMLDATFRYNDAARYHFATSYRERQATMFLGEQLRGAMSLYHAGRYGAARLRLLPWVSFNNFEGTTNRLLCYTASRAFRDMDISTATEFDEFVGKSKEEKDKLALQVDPRSSRKMLMELVQLLDMLESVYATEHGIRKLWYLGRTPPSKKVKALCEFILDQVYENCPGIEDQIAHLRAITPLYHEMESLEAILDGKSANTVYRANDSVIKLSTMRSNETWVSRYFHHLSLGFVDTQGLYELGYVYPENAETALEKIVPPELNMPPEYFSVGYPHVPQHVRRHLPEDGLVICYQNVPGCSLREFLRDNAEQRTQAIHNTVKQLATLHAYGPLHLIRQVPTIPTQSCRGMIDAHTRRRKKVHGFSDSDWASTLDACAILYARIDDREIDTYVKDANPNNWLLLHGVAKTVLPIDFELVMIGAAQFDLVKLIEHYPSQDPQHHLDHYIETYNKAARKFNRGLKKRHRKNPIRRQALFREIYEVSVIDHAIKSFHNQNYVDGEFRTQKIDWLQRGVTAIDWLQEHRDYSDTDTEKIIRLRNIFEKYREQTQLRLRA